MNTLPKQVLLNRNPAIRSSHNRTCEAERKIVRKNREGFLRNAFILTFGNVIAQAVILGLTPILTRIYSPESYGIFAIFFAISYPFSKMSSLRYDLAIFLAESEEDENLLAFLSIIIAVGFSAGLLLLTLCLAKPVSKALNVTRYHWVFYFIPIFVAIAGIRNVLSTLYLRKKAFSALSFSQVTGATGDRLASLSMGLSGFSGPGGLISGKILGEVTGLVTLLFQKRVFYRKGTAVFNIIWDRRRALYLTRRYKNFPRYVFSYVFETASTRAAPLLLSVFFHSGVVGHFALASRVLSEPMLMIGDALSRSFAQKASDLRVSGKGLARESELFLTYLGKLVIFPFLVFLLIGPDIFGVIFGHRWKEAGFYAVLLVPLALGNFLFQPFRIFFTLFERQRSEFVFNVVYFVANVGSLLVGGFSGRPDYCIAAYSFSAFFLFTVRLVWLLCEAGIHKARILRLSSTIFLECVIFFVPVLFIKYLWHASGLFLSVAGISSVFLYYGYLLVCDYSVRQALISVIGSVRFSKTVT